MQPTHEQYAQAEVRHYGAGAHVDPRQMMAVQPVPYPYPVQHTFEFDGGAADYLGVAILSTLLTVFTAGLALPWAISMKYSWQTRHTIVDGRRLEFTGTGASLFGHWIKWWFLCAITFGIYSFWVQPRLTKWIVEHQR